MRVKIDFELRLKDGGHIKAEGFRVDLPAENVSDAELARYLARALGLSGIQLLSLTNREIIDESHQRLPALIDVSHTIHHGMITYKGLPPPVIADFLSRTDSRAHYDPGTEFHIGRIEMVANTGTYLDSPFHRYAAGPDLAGLDLSSLANREGIVIRCPPQRAISRKPSWDL
jgi:Putative cyclase